MMHEGADPKGTRPQRSFLRSCRDSRLAGISGLRALRVDGPTVAGPPQRAGGRHVRGYLAAVGHSMALAWPVTAAGLAHVAVLKLDLLRPLAVPIDGGLMWQGRPLLGA